MEIFQKQMLLVEVYVTTKAKLSIQPPNNHSNTVMRQQPDHFSTAASTPAYSKARETHSYDKDSQRKENHRTGIQAGLLKSPPPKNSKDFAVPRPPAPLLTQRKKAPTHTDVPNKKASNFQSSAPQPGDTIQHIQFEIKGNNTLIQTKAEDNSRHLSKLMQRGVMPPGSTLQLLLKVVQTSSHKIYI